jgi:hypothetical protein
LREIINNLNKNTMNIEQEFKELHELLLVCYDEDYEEALDKALSKLDNLKKQLLLHGVSQQRELLKSFADWLQGEVWDDRHDDFSDYVEDYIKTL